MEEWCLGFGNHRGGKRPSGTHIEPVQQKAVAARRPARFRRSEIWPITEDDHRMGRDRKDAATGTPAVLITGDCTPDRRREVGQGSHWVDWTLWVLAVAFVLERLLEVHRSGSYGADFGVVWNSAKNFLHHGSHWSGYAYPPSSLLFVWPVALVPFRLARAAMFPLTSSSWPPRRWQ